MADDFTHSYMIFSADFDIKPVLKTYFETYPNGRHCGYEVVFEGKNVTQSKVETWSYIVVLEKCQGHQAEGVNIHDYLDSYCKVNDHFIVFSELNSIFPPLVRQNQTNKYRKMGNTGKYKDVK